MQRGSIVCHSRPLKWSSIAVSVGTAGPALESGNEIQDLIYTFTLTQQTALTNYNMDFPTDQKQNEKIKSGLI